MNDSWEAQYDGTTVTVGSLGQLRAAFAAGQLVGTTQVRRAGFEKWAPLADVLAVADGHRLGGGSAPAAPIQVVATASGPAAAPAQTSRPAVIAVLLVILLGLVGIVLSLPRDSWFPWGSSRADSQSPQFLPDQPITIFEDKRVTAVKSSSVRSCPDRTLEQMAKAFLSNPKWEAGTAPTGASFVNLSGGMTFHDKPVNALVQWTLSPGDSFELGAIEFNGVPQSKLLAIALLGKMCESAGGHPPAPSADELK
jgi:hypothetical protein